MYSTIKKGRKNRSVAKVAPQLQSSSSIANAATQLLAENMDDEDMFASISPSTDSLLMPPPMPVQRSPMEVLRGDPTLATTQEIANLPDAQMVDSQAPSAQLQQQQSMSFRLVPMKKQAKQWGNKSFWFTKGDDEYFVLNAGFPVPCSITIYNNLAIHEVPIADRFSINIMLQDMVNDCKVEGTLSRLDAENSLKTIFVRFDNKTQLFDVNGQPLKTLPNKNAFQAKVAIRFLGLYLKDGVIKPMLRLYQLRLADQPEPKLPPCIL